MNKRTGRPGRTSTRVRREPLPRRSACSILISDEIEGVGPLIGRHLALRAGVAARMVATSAAMKKYQAAFK